MTTMQPTTQETITQLEKARKLALGDSAYYPQIVPGVLPIIGPAAAVDLRRWGADFLAETFSSPAVSADAKQNMSLQVVHMLRQYLETTGEDSAVIKSVVQTATSIYPLVFKHTISNAADSQTWQTMATIKSNILRRIEKEPSGVKLCCIKFIQRVVQVQTPGQVADPRRPDQNEISLAIVPGDHPLISPSTLEAEAFGLLDRLLGVFQESTSDALIVTATLNSIGVLARTRASISNKILNAILTFNPFQFVGSTITPRIKVNAKSMEKTIRAFLFNFAKRMPNHPFAGRIQGYLDRLQQQRVEFLDPNSRKRPAPVEPNDGLDQNKRQRLGADVPNTSTQPQVPPLPSGPVSVAQLFTLTHEESRKSFDVQAIPVELVSRIVVPLLASIDTTQLNSAIAAIRTRLQDLSKPSPISAAQAAQVATGQALPPSTSAQATEQLYNQLENTPSDRLALASQPGISLGPFIIPQPPPLTPNELAEYGNGAIARVFENFTGLEEVASKAARSSFTHRAAGNQDRDSWVTVVSRLATRSLTGLDGEDTSLIKHEKLSSVSLAHMIRDAMHLYIIGDFRKRIDVAVSWLNEEWYNDMIQTKTTGGSAYGMTPVYDRLVLKLIDALVPYLDAKDNKVLIRFLSEIPAVNRDILERIKRLARDPERVPLAVTTIHYLVLFRPPAREMCIDALEDLYQNYADTRAATTKLLQKWRPNVLQASTEDPRALKVGGSGSPALVKSPVPA